MARIHCTYSGVVFNCEHMPSGLSNHEHHHPLFSVPQKKLLSLVKDWSANRLSPTESYLLYLSLLHSTDLLIWRTTARFTDKTLRIIGNNMEHLVQIVGKINVIKHPSFVLPKFAITYDTGDLGNSFYWIQAWISNYKEWNEDFIDAHKKEEIKHKVERREHSLEKLIKTPMISEEKLADNLAYWARLTCDFPEDIIQHPHYANKKVVRADFWEEVIRACAKDEKIWKYAKGTVHTIIEHCEENLDPQHAGTIHSHALMKLLRNGLKRREAYTGFGDVDLAGKTTQFKLLSPNASAEDANIVAAIQSAPEKEPKKENYQTFGAYLRAKLNWDLAQRNSKRS